MLQSFYRECPTCREPHRACSVHHISQYTRITWTLTNGLEATRNNKAPFHEAWLWCSRTRLRKRQGGRRLFTLRVVATLVVQHLSLKNELLECRFPQGCGIFASLTHILNWCERTCSAALSRARSVLKTLEEVQIRFIGGW